MSSVDVQTALITNAKKGDIDEVQKLYTANYNNIVALNGQDKDGKTFLMYLVLVYNMNKNQKVKELILDIYKNSIVQVDLRDNTDKKAIDYIKDFRFRRILLDIKRTSKLIGEGTYGCVYKEPVVCVSGEQYSGVGKVGINQEVELHALEIAKRLDPTGQYHVPLTTVCDVNYPNDECTRSKLPVTKKPAQQMVFPFGGVSLYKTTPTKELVYNMLNLFRGLATFNSQGFYHLDIKPANIMVDNSVPKLIDFGLATLASEAERPNELYKTIYPFWPPEMILLSYSGEIKRDDIWFHIREYVKYNPVKQLVLNRYAELPQMQPVVDGILDIPNKVANILEKADVFGLGVTLLYILLDVIKFDFPQKDKIIELGMKMIQLVPINRITMRQAMLEFTKIIENKPTSLSLFYIPMDDNVSTIESLLKRPEDVMSVKEYIEYLRQVLPESGKAKLEMCLPRFKNLIEYVS